MSVWNIAFLVLVVVALTFYPLLLGFVMWWSNQTPKAAVRPVKAEDQPAQAKAEYPKAA